MTGIGGYQSDFNLSNERLTGNLPVENSLGGYGLAARSRFVDVFVAEVDPPLKNNFPDGMVFNLVFDQTNQSTHPHLGINDQSERLMALRTTEGAELMEEGYIQPGLPYRVISMDEKYLIDVMGSRAPQAKEDAPGAAEIATEEETIAGEDDSRIVTPLKLKAVLTTKIKPMRSQIKFYSESLQETTITQDSPAEYLEINIPVTGLPEGAIIHQATLCWEGNIRNSAMSLNHLADGHLAFKKDDGEYDTFLDLSLGVRLEAGQVTFQRLVEENVKAKISGNGTYMARFQSTRAQADTIVVSGQWILEIDYERPVS